MYPFTEEVTWKQGALFEPSTVSLHALLLADYCGKGSVAVIGCGTIGLFAIQWARILGAKQIVAVNRGKEKLELAVEMGATDTVSTLDEDWYEQLMALTDARGFDYVFDATGNAEIMKQALRFAGNRSKVCMIGTPKNEISFSVQEWEQINRKELYLTGSWMSYSAPFPGKEWEMTAHHFDTGELIYDEKMISEVLPLSRIAEAFTRYQVPGMVKGKILIDSEA